MTMLCLYINNVIVHYPNQLESILPESLVTLFCVLYVVPEATCKGVHVFATKLKTNLNVQ